MAKIINFGDFLSKRELDKITAWAMKTFPAPEKKKMHGTQMKYRITHRHESRSVIGVLEYDRRETVQPLADALNKRFPSREYKVEVVRTATAPRQKAA